MRKNKIVIFAITIAIFGLFSLASCSSDDSTDDDYTSIESTFEMNDYITDAYYTGTDYSDEQLYVNTIDSVDASVVDMVCYDEDGDAEVEGSGVLFAWDTTNDLSYIITCFHMVEDYYSYTVETVDGTEYNAMLVGGYADQDLAIIAISTDDDTISSLTYSTLLSSDSTLSQGQTAIAIGNNDGYSHTTSDGIVSYVDRQWTTSTYNYKTLNELQITTEINGGSSGGGIYSTSGALIGITNAGVETNSEGYSVEGVKFAIPYTNINEAIDNIISTSSYSSSNSNFEEGYFSGDFEFGFSLSTGTTQSGFTTSTVVYVSSTIDSLGNESYSDYGEFDANDIITGMEVSYADTSKSSVSVYDITSTATVWEMLYQNDLSIGDTVTFTVTRDNESVSIAIELTQFTFQAL